MHYFGTDGIRGKAYVTLTESLAIKVGKSLSLIDNHKVIIGYDTRESNHMLADAISLGARSVNKDVFDIGVIPTPALAYCSLKERCIGIMITASHNPYFDNGIKIFVNGIKLSVSQEQQIEEYLDNNDDYIENKNNGSYRYDESYKNIYIDYLNSLLNVSSLKVGADLANGATYDLFGKIFANKVNDLFITANTPNGRNINENVGSTHIKNISEFVKENKLDIGFSFDGDGDRLLVVDNEGILHTGDEIIYVLANYLKENNKLTNNKVVLTIMSNLGIIDCFKEKGIDVATTSVGDKYVLECLMDNNYSIGGENSGHIIMLDYLPTGDGMLAAIMLLNVLTTTKKTLKELTSELKIYPDKLVNLKVKDKNIIKNELVVNKVNEFINLYNKNIQLVVRASGTEDLVRVSCCYSNYDIMNNIVDEMVNLIKSLDK